MRVVPKVREELSRSCSSEPNEVAQNHVPDGASSISTTQKQEFRLPTTMVDENRHLPLELCSCKRHKKQEQGLQEE